MKSWCGEAWIVEFFPAIYLVTQKVPETRAVTDTTRPTASYWNVSVLRLVASSIELLTHAYNSDRLMLFVLGRRHDELERFGDTNLSDVGSDVECRLNVTPLAYDFHE